MIREETSATHGRVSHPHPPAAAKQAVAVGSRDEETVIDSDDSSDAGWASARGSNRAGAISSSKGRAPPGVGAAEGGSTPPLHSLWTESASSAGLTVVARKKFCKPLNNLSDFEPFIEMSGA